MARLEDWSGMPLDGRMPYMLAGRVFGHPRQPDGKLIVTSRIVSFSGRRVTTKTGTVYELGRMDPGFRRIVESAGAVADDENPLSNLESRSEPIRLLGDEGRADHQGLGNGESAPAPHHPCD